MNSSIFKSFVKVLLNPNEALHLNASGWTELIRAARSTDLLAKLAAKLKASGVWDQIPLAPKRHLQGALMVSTRQHVEVVAEIEFIKKALGELPFVLLKGAAYIRGGLLAAEGRVVSDIDILVSRDILEEAEHRLMLEGWVSTKPHFYDQRYYRQWMHEVPPLKHLTRGTTLDLHHTILPLTADLKPNPKFLIDNAVAIDDQVFVFSPADMVLHSATHLFHEGDLELGLRGLVDIVDLINEFDLEKNFWSLIEDRATLLNLEWPLLYALRYIRLLFSVEYSAQLELALARKVGFKEGSFYQKKIDSIFINGFMTSFVESKNFNSKLSELFLYLRGHFLRMPPLLLIPHLLRKAYYGFHH